MQREEAGYADLLFMSMMKSLLFYLFKLIRADAAQRAFEILRKRTFMFITANGTNPFFHMETSFTL